MEFSKDQLKRFFEEKSDKAVERLDKTPTNKLIITSLVVFSVGVVVLGILQMKSYLDKPFFADKLVEDKGKIRGPMELIQYIKDQRANGQELLTLQQRDTDGDGLTDYQEAYIYKTNMYSKDTDNDGVSDKDEVIQGGTVSPSQPTTGSSEPVSEPKPPSPALDTLTNDMQAGVEAGVEKAIQGQTGATTELEAGTDTPTNPALNDMASLSAEQKDQLKLYFQSLGPAELRSLLVEQGFPQDQVASLNDEDLFKAMEQLLQSF